jgi:hypothetical protein
MVSRWRARRSGVIALVELFGRAVDLGSSSSFLPVVGTKVITRRLAVSVPECVAAAKRDVQHADVQLLAILERVDPKPLGVEELPALAGVLAAGLVARISGTS